MTSTPGDQRSPEDLAREVERLSAGNARLRDEAAQWKDRATSARVDGDRRERRAAEAAADCARHGEEIQYLRHMASWYWNGQENEAQARRAMVMGLIKTVQAIDPTGEPFPAAELRKSLQKAIDAHLKVLHRPSGYPVPADCIRAGGCDHDGISNELKTDVARVLGITPEHCQNDREPGR